MCKSFATLILAVVTLCMLTSCPGLQDWIYDELPNGYEIAHINSQDIELLKEEDGLHIPKIDRYIKEFCYNDTYIGVKRLMIDESIPYESVKIEEFDQSNLSYYLVDTADDNIMGPYTDEEYEAKINELDIQDMCDWIKTVPRPQGAE